jgi:hypothetical protein
MGAIINNFREQLSARCGDALACRNPPRQTARPPQGWRGHHRNLLLRNVEYPASRLAGIMEVGPKASASASREGSGEEIFRGRVAFVELERYVSIFGGFNAVAFFDLFGVFEYFHPN